MAKSYSQLLQERERLEAAIQAARAREVSGVIKRMREAIEAYGLTAQDVFGGVEPRAKTAVKQTKAKATAKPAKKVKGAAGKRPPKVKAKAHPLQGKKKPVKYADKNGNTWAGGGYKPKWLQDAIDQGHKIEEFLVQKAA